MILLDFSHTLARVLETFLCLKNPENNSCRSFLGTAIKRKTRIYVSRRICDMKMQLKDYKKSSYAGGF